MVEIQVGSKQQPIILNPRINGNLETVNRIKTVFSNYFVSDGTTPINFVMETRTRTGSKVLLNYDASRSDENDIYFFPADSFYESVVKYTALFYWTIDIEQVYTERPVIIDVKEIHDES